MLRATSCVLLKHGVLEQVLCFVGSYDKETGKLMIIQGGNKLPTGKLMIIQGAHLSVFSDEPSCRELWIPGSHPPNLHSLAKSLTFHNSIRFKEKQQNSKGIQVHLWPISTDSEK